MYQTVRRLLHEGVAPNRLWWLRLDHPLLMQLHLGGLVQLFLDRSNATPEKPLFLFLDELVYADEWDLWLKTFYDERLPVRIVATASASASLHNRRLESGIGRWEEQYLSPYILTEYLDLLHHSIELEVGEKLAETLVHAVTSNVDLAGVGTIRRRYLLTGGFPELLVTHANETSDEASSLLESQAVLRSEAVERAVYKDIPQEFGIDNPMMLERLLYLLAGQVTGILSPTNLCRDLNGPTAVTVDRYISYLYKAFLVFTLQNYSTKEAVVQRRGRKLYFIDGAVRNAALQRGLGPLSNPQEMGHLYENAAAAHLHALARQTQTRLFFWRNGGDEVDLVYDDPQRPLAFEIASSVNHHRKGLRAFLDMYPRFEGGIYTVAPDAPAVTPVSSKTGIGSLPLDLFLIAVGKQAEQELRRRLAPTL